MGHDYQKISTPGHLLPADKLDATMVFYVHQRNKFYQKNIIFQPGKKKVTLHRPAEDFSISLKLIFISTLYYVPLLVPPVP